MLSRKVSRRQILFRLVPAVGAASLLGACASPGLSRTPSWAGAPSASGAPISQYTVDHPYWFFSPGNWYVSGAKYARTNNPGAYCKLKFNATGLRLAFDLRLFKATRPDAKAYPYLKWKADDDAFREQQLTATMAEIVLAGGLVQGEHSLEVYVESVAGNRDRWNTPSASIDLTGVTVIGGILSPPTLRPQRWLAFGDSITEGTNSDGDSYSTADQSAARSWSVQVAEGRDAEVGVIGFCSQGYSTMGPPRSDVPPFHNTTVNTWAELWRGQPRSFASVDAVLVNHGTNDLDLADSELTLYIRDFLTDFRAANPSLAIHLVVPFGGFKRATFADAFRAYQVASRDANCSLIDISQRDPILLEDLDGDTSFTTYSTDGLHPNQAGHDRIAELMLQALLAHSIQTRPK